MINVKLVNKTIINVKFSNNKAKDRSHIKLNNLILSFEVSKI